MTPSTPCAAALAEFVACAEVSVPYMVLSTPGYRWHDAMAAARAALAAVPREQWQPISTAPKGGTVMLANSGGCWIAHWEPIAVSGYRFDQPWRSSMLNHWHMPSDQRYMPPTHWAPLPAPPIPSALQDQPEIHQVHVAGDSGVASGGGETSTGECLMALAVVRELTQTQHQDLDATIDAVRWRFSARNEREAFEAWADANQFDTHRDDTDKYRDYHRATTRWAWMAWQAALPPGATAERKCDNSQQCSPEARYDEVSHGLTSLTLKCRLCGGIRRSDWD